jgi:hypothetical protein
MVIADETSDIRVRPPPLHSSIRISDGEVPKFRWGDRLS